jgi:hypothetical protein
VRSRVALYTNLLIFYCFFFLSHSLSLSNILSSSSSLRAFISGFSSPAEVGLGLVVHVSGNFEIPMGETPPLILLNRRHNTPHRASRRQDGPRTAGSTPPRSASPSGSSPSPASSCTSPSP